jgi:hypothetical protein
MKLIEYGANAVSDYDFDSSRKPETFYRYAYLDLVCIEDKALLHFEIDQSRFRYFCLAVQFGGDSFFRISANIWRVGLDFCVWGYG